MPKFANGDRVKLNDYTGVVVHNIADDYGHIVIEQVHSGKRWFTMWPELTTKLAPNQYTWGGVTFEETQENECTGGEHWHWLITRPYACGWRHGTYVGPRLKVIT